MGGLSLSRMYMAEKYGLIVEEYKQKKIEEREKKAREELWDTTTSNQR